jgi:hypothetical protein
MSLRLLRNGLERLEGALQVADRGELILDEALLHNVPREVDGLLSLGLLQRLGQYAVELSDVDHAQADQVRGEVLGHPAALVREVLARELADGLPLALLADRLKHEETHLVEQQVHVLHGGDGVARLRLHLLRQDHDAREQVHQQRNGVGLGDALVDLHQLLLDEFVVVALGRLGEAHVGEREDVGGVRERRALRVVPERGLLDDLQVVHHLFHGVVRAGGQERLVDRVMVRQEDGGSQVLRQRGEGRRRARGDGLLRIAALARAPCLVARLPHACELRLDGTLDHRCRGLFQSLDDAIQVLRHGVLDDLRHCLRSEDARQGEREVLAAHH